MAGLLPQVMAAGGRVQVQAWWNNGTPTLPEIRQRMLRDARTDYVSFVDDDDLVSPDYVPEILAALDQRPDYVGFQVQCYSDGAPTAIAYHSLAHGGWSNGAGTFLRDITHLNPIRTEIARAADFRRARPGQAEDRVWVNQVRAGRRLKTEVMIDRVMYHYLYSTSKRGGVGSRWKNPRLIRRADRPLEITTSYFSYHPECLTHA
jgi:hypothetical protein